MLEPAHKDGEMPVTVGVDTHLDEHVALDHLGRRLGVLTIPTTQAGYTGLLRWARPLSITRTKTPANDLNKHSIIL